MKKLIRNTSDSERRAFWESVSKSAEAVGKSPAWVQAGIDLNEEHYTTFRPRQEEATEPPPPPSPDEIDA